MVVSGGNEIVVKLGSLTAVRMWCSGSDDGVVARDGGQ